HCLSGYRASIVGSLVAAPGRRVVVVNDHFLRSAAAAGLTIVPEAEPVGA
nr:MBL fold metallo-hydrolase [Actinomycetales bacterium]